MEDEKYMNETEVAQWIGISKSKLQNDRWQSKGIPYLKVGGKKIIYKKSDVVAYLDSFRVQLND